MYYIPYYHIPTSYLVCSSHVGQFDFEEFHLKGYFHYYTECFFLVLK